MSGAFEITNGAAQQIATAHDHAAEDITNTSGGLPAVGVDGGEAAAILTQIIGKVVGDCADLAAAHQGAAAIMRQVAADYHASEDEVAGAFDRIGARLGDGS